MVKFVVKNEKLRAIIMYNNKKYSNIYILFEMDKVFIATQIKKSTILIIIIIINY